MPSRPGAIISGTAVAGSKGSRIAAANSRSLLRYRDVTTPGATPAAAATDFTVVCVYPRAANAVRAACSTAPAACCGSFGTLTMRPD